MRKRYSQFRYSYAFLLTAAAIAMSASAQPAAVNEWAWVGGATVTDCSPNTCNQPAVYGTFGVPGPGTDPGSREFGATWTDASGNFWLLGGTPGLSALWEFNPATKEWAWMAPSDLLTCAYLCLAGEYSALGTPAVGDFPGVRQQAMTWADTKGNLWLFGGLGYDRNETSGALNDLWEFIPSTGAWGWISGSSLVTCVGDFGPCGVAGIYGTLGVASSANVPGGRFGAMTWSDSRGHLWMFGGTGDDDSNPLTGSVAPVTLNDLWQFDPSTNEWTWMGGSESDQQFYGQSGIYGTLGAFAAANIPGSRTSGVTWTDSAGNFWLFGGVGFDSGGYDGPLNDLWEFNPSTDEWAWVGGSNEAQGCHTTSCPITAVYGTLGTAAAGNIPGPRTEASAWTDNAGNFWLFGGEGVDGAGNYGDLNDLWEFNPATMLWAWMGGSSTMPCNYIVDGNDIYGTICVQPGVYGTLGTPAPGNSPGGRLNAQSWVDNDGNLWLFGGTTDENFSALTGELDDVWEFHPASATMPKVATPTFSVGEGSYAAAQSVSISDTTNGATIYYTTDGTIPTTSSAVVKGAIAFSSTGTLEAMAAATDYYNSDVISATYTILPGFSIAASPASLTVNAGSSGTTTVSVTPSNGFDSAVSFACSGLPTGASCSFSPSTVTPPGTTSTTLTIATSATTAALHRRSGPLPPEALLTATLCCFGLKKRRRLQLLVLLGATAIGLSILTACGSGSSGGGSGGGGGSQPVTSTVTVTATSGSLQQTTTFTLTVN